MRTAVGKMKCCSHCEVMNSYSCFWNSKLTTVSDSSFLPILRLHTPTIISHLHSFSINIMLEKVLYFFNSNLIVLFCIFLDYCFPISNCFYFTEFVGYLPLPFLSYCFHSFVHFWYQSVHPWSENCWLMSHWRWVHRWGKRLTWVYSILCVIATMKFHKSHIEA